MDEEGLSGFFAALGEALAAAGGAGEAAAAGLAATAAWFRAEGGLLLLRRHEGDRLEVRAAWGESAAGTRGKTLPAAAAGALPAAAAGLLSGPGAGEKAPPELGALFEPPPAVLAASPLRGRKRVFGALILAARSAESFDAAGLETLGAAALYIAQVIEKLCYLRIGRRLASVDSLTGVLKRRALEKTLTAEIDRCKRYSAPLSVLWIELDDFKRITETFGHAAADRVLVEAARILGRNVRNVDTLARYGGDEFVILLPNTDRESAQVVRQRILTDLEAYNAAKQELPFQMSVGLHTAGPEGVEDILTYSDLDLKRRRYIQEELEMENLEIHLDALEMEEPE